LFLLPVLVLYTLAIWGRRQKEAVFPWKSGFVCGLGVTLIAGFFSPAVQWVIHTWISPGYFAAAIAHAVAQGQDRALMEQFFNLRAYIAQSLIGSLLMGTLVSALVGFLLRKSPKK
jgi:4-amino-4-deoxy-L-arabinose transferase-like glycosyltransferase